MQAGFSLELAVPAGPAQSHGSQGSKHVRQGKLTLEVEIGVGQVEHHAGHFCRPHHGHWAKTWFTLASGVSPSATRW